MGVSRALGEVGNILARLSEEEVSLGKGLYSSRTLCVQKGRIDMLNRQLSPG